MTRRWRALRARLSAVALGIASIAVACTRHADIRDEYDSPFIGKPPEVDGGDLLPVSLPLGPPDYAACAERPDTACYGDLDFPCGFDVWASEAAKACQQATGCTTNGDLEIALGTDGCVAGVRMTKPSDAFVACLAGIFGATRCPCVDAPTVDLFLGLGNDGCD